MIRLFFQLYFLIVGGLFGIGWCLDKIWESYDDSNDSPHTPYHQVLSILESQLRDKTREEMDVYIYEWTINYDLDVEIFDANEISGDSVKRALESNKVAAMSTNNNKALLLKKIDNRPHIIALNFSETQTHSAIGWALTLIFCAGIGLLLMFWVWPLSRDLKKLEITAQQFGVDKKVSISDIKTSSQIYSLADSFNRMQARIDKLIESHKLLSNAIAHELKTPLARMKFEIAAALQSDDSNSDNNLIEIEQNINEMNALISAILDYASFERKDFQIALARHNINDLMRSIVATSEMYKEDLSISISNDHKKAITFDAYLVERAIRNLFYNAIKYADRKIALSFEQIDGKYCFSIEDDGPGISDTDKHKVFNSFYRAKQENQNSEGFGLGLAIVQSIMEWHNGIVEVSDSELGGARFIMCWPEKTLQD